MLHGIVDVLSFNDYTLQPDQSSCHESTSLLMYTCSDCLDRQIQTMLDKKDISLHFHASVFPFLNIFTVWQFVLMFCEAHLAQSALALFCLTEYGMNMLRTCDMYDISINCHDDDGDDGADGDDGDRFSRAASCIPGRGAAPCCCARGACEWRERVLLSRATRCTAHRQKRVSPT